MKYMVGTRLLAAEGTELSRDGKLGELAAGDGF